VSGRELNFRVGHWEFEIVAGSSPSLRCISLLKQVLQTGFHFRLTAPFCILKMSSPCGSHNPNEEFPHGRKGKHTQNGRNREETRSPESRNSERRRRNGG
jgi:hypothetical protein